MSLLRLCLLAAPALAGALALPPLGTAVYVVPSVNPLNQALRHCNYVASFDGIEAGSDDFRFTLVAALNGAPAPAFSLRSVNFPEQHLTYKSSGLPAGSRVGIEAVGADVATASWALAAAAGAADGAVTLTSLSQRPALAGARLTRATNASGPCNAGRNHDARLEAAGAGGAAAQAFVLQTHQPSPGPSPSPAPAPAPVPAQVAIDASASKAQVNPAVLGCHMDPGSPARGPQRVARQPSHAHPPLPPPPTPPSKALETTPWPGPPRSSTARAFRPMSQPRSLPGTT
jgi:hypothetical protein